MSILNDPGNIVVISVIAGLLLYFWWLKRRAERLPDVTDPGPVLEPVNYEEFYNNKYPKTDILYDGRKVPWRPGRYNIDVRNFFNRYDSNVRKIVERLDINGLDDHPDNDKALACLNWVLGHVKYAPDKNADGSQTEYWNFAFETLLQRSFEDPQLYGDCEDSGILLANLMLASKIPYWKIRLTAGDVDDNMGNAGGHVFVTFFDEPRARWVLLDTTYYPNRLPISARKDYKSESYYKDTWFSWNERYGFAFDTRAVANMKNCNV